MAENLIDYTVGVDFKAFDTAIKKMEKFQKQMTNFENKETRAAVARQKLDNAHVKAREKNNHDEYKKRIKREDDVTKAHISAIKENIKFDKKRQDNIDKSHIAAIKENIKFDNKRQDDVDKAHVAAIKENIKRERAAKKARIQAKEDEANQIAKIESKRRNSLTQAQTTFGRSSLNLRTYQAGSVNAGAQQELRRAVAAAKTADEVRLLVAKERERLRVMKEQERSLNKQNFLMQRMTASSKQFAGNMVSAFAVAGLTAGITRVGQDFESVNNTLLAVSSSAQEAGSNFQFVRDESYRLGLSLADSGKNFAKMLSARGKMSLEDTKAAFSGVSEMSTLLGLSSAESTRAKRLWLL